MTGGLLELGEVMLSVSERKLETVSRNVANISTPGFKRETSFQNVLLSGAAGVADNAVGARADFSQGGLRVTGNPFDLALSGAGLFKLRSETGVFFSRGGQFERAANGAMVNALGFALQTTSGEDLVLRDSVVEVLEDGTVLESGLPIARIGVFHVSQDNLQSLGGGLFTADESAVQDVASPILRQGMIETSNVELSGEMMEMMTALRQAEAGSRIVQVFDALSEQMISTFGGAR